MLSYDLDCSFLKVPYRTVCLPRAVTSYQYFSSEHHTGTVAFTLIHCVSSHMLYQSHIICEHIHSVQTILHRPYMNASFYSTSFLSVLTLGISHSFSPSFLSQYCQQTVHVNHTGAVTHIYLIHSMNIEY